MERANRPLRIALAYNPALPARRLGRVTALARTLEGRGHIVSHHDSDALELTDTAGRIDVLCLCGGDGTVRLAVSQTANLPPLAIYPIGTINLLARELGYPLDPMRFAALIEGARAKVTTRVATINGTPFMACASAGFDAHVVANLSEPLKLRVGRLAYVAAAARLLAQWPRQTMVLDTGTETLTAEAAFVLRGKFYAGPWTLDREAHLGQEALRVLTLPRARRRDIAALLAYALSGIRRPLPNWLFLSCSRLTIASRTPMPVQADGDAVATTPVEIVMTDRKVTFV